MCSISVSPVQMHTQGWQRKEGGRREANETLALATELGSLR